MRGCVSFHAASLDAKAKPELRPGAKESRAVIENWWRQGMTRGDGDDSLVEQAIRLGVSYGRSP